MDDEMVPSAGFAPAPRRPQRRVLTDDTTEGVMVVLELAAGPGIAPGPSPLQGVVQTDYTTQR